VSPGEGVGTLISPDSVFVPVRSQTAFEETVDRLGNAIKLGLLAPGARLPAERELCTRLGIARSTLRQALTALGQSGHVYAVRGRGGGTFVSDPLPPVEHPSDETLAEWREVCDQRLAVELGVAVLAAERATPEAISALDELASSLETMLEDFDAYRPVDIRLHVGLADATGSARLVSAMTEVQGAIGALIHYIAHPPEVLANSNAQHRRLLAAVRERDSARAAREMTEHVQATEHILAGLMPAPGNPLRAG
jgi:DNA-binding FadR family transcriptional regulator